MLKRRDVPEVCDSLRRMCSADYARGSNRGRVDIAEVISHWRENIRGRRRDWDI